MGRHRTLDAPVVDGHRMMAARRAAGLNRATAAARLGVSESAINRYEQGISDPSAGVLVTMAWLYRVSVERLCRPRAEVMAELSGHAEEFAAARAARLADPAEELAG